MAVIETVTEGSPSSTTDESGSGVVVADGVVVKGVSVSVDGVLGRGDVDGVGEFVFDESSNAFACC